MFTSISNVTEVNYNNFFYGNDILNIYDKLDMFQAVHEYIITTKRLSKFY